MKKRETREINIGIIAPEYLHKKIKTALEEFETETIQNPRTDSIHYNMSFVSLNIEPTTEQVEKMIRSFIGRKKVNEILLTDSTYKNIKNAFFETQEVILKTTLHFPILVLYYEDRNQLDYPVPEE